MALEETDFLSETEAALKKNFSAQTSDKRRFPSNSTGRSVPERFDQLTLPDEMRAPMPFTKEKYLVKENPHLVQWERETRKFLRKLSPDHEHRVAATMIYEWATGLAIKDLMESPETPEPGKPTWRGDLRKINKILEFYFGKPYMTWIMGKKVGKAYRVKKGTFITRKRPMTLTLYAEYVEGVLIP